MPRLTPVDWIQAGFRVLTAAGIDRVRVEPLASELGVSKGSFYWHFKNRRALHAAMLQHWHYAATENIIKLVEEAEREAEARLRRLVQLAAAPAPDAYGGAGVESAIRDWARHDSDARDTLEKVDAQRVAYVESLFKLSGFNRADSVARSHCLYATLVGLDTLPPHRDRDRVALLQLALDALLVKRPR